MCYHKGWKHDHGNIENDSGRLPYLTHALGYLNKIKINYKFHNEA